MVKDAHLNRRLEFLKPKQLRDPANESATMTRQRGVSSSAFCASVR
jgi:hypothetical protein